MNVTRVCELNGLPYTMNPTLPAKFGTLVERLVLRSEDTGIINHFHIGFDANTGQARIHNEATNEVVPVTDEFISRWSVNEA